MAGLVPAIHAFSSPSPHPEESRSDRHEGRGRLQRSLDDPSRTPAPQDEVSGAKNGVRITGIRPVHKASDDVRRELPLSKSLGSALIPRHIEHLMSTPLVFDRALVRRRLQRAMREGYADFLLVRA